MITFVSAWYVFKAKFNKATYETWIQNLVSNVRKFNLVIFTNKESQQIFTPLLFGNPNIKIIVVETEEFYTYKYKREWIENHIKNTTLISLVNWQVNMLWSEKIHFVKKVIQDKIFDTEFYGWCDIGYFRCRENMDIPKDAIQRWPDWNKIKSLSQNKIYYCQVCNDEYLNKLKMFIRLGHTIPPRQNSIAGGFFVLHKKNIDWWYNTYYTRLDEYFKEGKLVKDDQMIIIDCIAKNESFFKLITHRIKDLDPWFGFQTYLL